MDTTDLVAMSGRAEQLRKDCDHAEWSADMAAHQLARAVSDRLAGGRVYTLGQYDELRAMVEVYNLAWVAYLSARDEAREASQDYLDAADPGSTADTGARQTDVDA